MCCCKHECAHGVGWCFYWHWHMFCWICVIGSFSDCVLKWLCAYLALYLWMIVCVCFHVHVCIHVCVCVCVCVCVYVCVHVSVCLNGPQFIRLLLTEAESLVVVWSDVFGPVGFPRKTHFPLWDSDCAKPISHCGTGTVINPYPIMGRGLC